MTDREVMQMTLEALERVALHLMRRQGVEVMQALRAQLEQPLQEPVHGDIRALRYRIFELEGEVLGYKRMLDVAEAPPQRKPLTDDEIIEIAKQSKSAEPGLDGYILPISFARAIEQANSIKGKV